MRSAIVEDEQAVLMICNLDRSSMSGSEVVILVLDGLCDFGIACAGDRIASRLFCLLTY